MKKLIILLALCCAMLFFTSCIFQLTLPVPEETPSLEPSSNMDDLDALTLTAEEGEVLPDSLLLAPVVLFQVLEGNLTGYVRLRVDGWGMYAYEDGIFRCVERLTMQPKPDSTMDKSDFVWQYVEEAWVDRAWITEVWNCDEHTEEETQARYDEEGGLWELSAGRWTDWI